MATAAPPLPDAPACVTETFVEQAREQRALPQREKPVTASLFMSRDP
jgi:hypothetical protein